MKTNELISILRDYSNPNVLDYIDNAADTLETQQKRIEELEGQLKSAVHDLGVASECWSCKRNNKCHPNSPVSGPDVCCGSYQWRGATDNHVGGKWIRPEERLPDVHKPVLVCREKEPGVLIVEQGCKDLGDWWRVYGTRVKRIRFWMPLPEPPGEV